MHPQALVHGRLARSEGGARSLVLRSRNVHRGVHSGASSTVLPSHGATRGEETCAGNTLCYPCLSPLIAALGSGSGPEWKAVKPSSPASPSSQLHRSVNGSAQMVELVLQHPSVDVNIGRLEGLAPLMLASAAGRSDIVEVLLSHRDIDVNACSQQFETALSWVGQADREFSSAKPDDDTGPVPKRYNPGILAVQRILSHPQLDPDLICDRNGRTPLMLASMLGLDSLVRTLLVQPEKSPSHWITAASTLSFFAGITSAFQSTHPSPATSQRDLSSSPRRGDTRSRSGLLVPPSGHIKSAENSALQLFRQRVERVNRVDSQGKSPVMLALSPLNSNVQHTVEVLLSHPHIDINQQDINGNTVLIIASRRHEMTTARALLARDDIDINRCNRKGTSALMAAAACQRGDPVAMLELLLQDSRIRDVNQTNAEGKSALHLALLSATQCQGIAASICLISSKLVDVNLRDGTGDTPLHFASYHGIPDVATALLRRPEIEVNNLDRHGSTAIHIACERKQREVICVLLQHKDIDLDSTNASGYAPIHLAAESGDASVMFSLLQHPSININCTNRHGYAAIHIAARLAVENAAVMQVLLKHPRIDVNLRDSEGYTAVDVLAKFPNPAALTTLLRHPRLEAHPLHHHRTFYSACWREVYSGRPAKIDRRRMQAFLLHDPECVRFTDTLGRTVLHHAAKQGCHELVERIVHGAWDVWDDADFSSRDLEGKTALDYAVEEGKASIQWLLENPSFHLGSILC